MNPLYDYMFSNLNGRQNYVDCEEIDELLTRSSLWQPKFDGIWCAVISTEKDRFDVYSRTGKHKTTINCHGFPKGMILIGEYMFGTQWSLTHFTNQIALFDCVLSQGTLYDCKPYTERWATARAIALTFDTHFVPVNCVRGRDDVRTLNTSFSFEGVVGRNESDLWNSKVFRWKKKVTDDVHILAVEEGRGRLAGTMGALICQGYHDGKSYGIAVGGGFTDEQRKWFWDNANTVQGMVIEIEGRARFDSGALRHPNFKRIRK